MLLNQLKKAILAFCLFAVFCASAGSLNTFTLPDRALCEGFYYPDIQDSFPAVDFTTLDRLYIPAQHYKFMRIGNLPLRSTSRPLIITNIGGQVRVGGCGHHFNFVIGGGSNWILTGQYSAFNETGNINFKGHQNGFYANSAGTYGILIDADFGAAKIGLAVGTRATDYEISFIESRNLEFAGMMFKTDSDGTAHMDNVKIHDNYVHDTISEGVYLGSTQSQPQHKFHNLQFYNNRIIRTGTEMSQFGQLANNSRIHHNVFLLGALDWKNPFQQFQDSGMQFLHREGSMEFDHNIIIGAASNNMIIFNPELAGDIHNAGDIVDIHDNYFSYSRRTGIYIHSQSDPIKKIFFHDNYFSKVIFSYDELSPSSTPRPIIFSDNSVNPIELSNNIFDNQVGQDFYSGGANITATNNTSQNIAEIAFHDLGWTGVGDYFTMEIWTAIDINSQPVQFFSGDLVLHNSLIYKAVNDIDYTTAATDSPDVAGAAIWQPQPAMHDDVRQHISSPFVDIGLLDIVNDLIFLNNFE